MKKIALFFGLLASVLFSANSFAAYSQCYTQYLSKTCYAAEGTDYYVMQNLNCAPATAVDQSWTPPFDPSASSLASWDAYCVSRPSGRATGVSCLNTAFNAQSDDPYCACSTGYAYNHSTNDCDLCAAGYVFLNGGCMRETSVIYDADQNTYVSTEFNIDENKIRLVVDGLDRATVDPYGLAFPVGAVVNEFSTDDTLADNSDIAVPTEKAVKGYVDDTVGGISFWTRNTTGTPFLTPTTISDKILFGLSALVTDFPNAQMVISNGDSGQSNSYSTGLVIESSASSTQPGVGLQVFGVTNESFGATAIRGGGIVSDPEDPFAAMGGDFYSAGNHTAAVNISLESNASGSSVGNYSFHSLLGKMLQTGDASIGGNFVDFPDAKLFVSKGNTGESILYHFGIVGESIAAGIYPGVGVGGFCKTSNQAECSALLGRASPNDKDDAYPAVGMDAFSYGEHDGDVNIGVRSSAQGSSKGNYAFFGTLGGLSYPGVTAYRTGATELLAVGDAVPITGTLVRVAGDGAAKTLTSTPTIPAGVDGQILILQGDSDTETVTLQDESNLTGSGLSLMDGKDLTLVKGKFALLMYDAGDAKWYELPLSPRPSQETLLGSVSGINANISGYYDLFQVPTDKHMVITRVVVRCTASTAVAVEPIVSVGGNTGSYSDYLNDTQLTGLDAYENMSFAPVNGEIYVNYYNLDTIKFSVETAATATVMTLGVELYGYVY